MAIDEFQKIADFEEDNVEALLRTKIQHLNDFIIRHNLKTASTVQTAMRGLMEKGIVCNWRGSRQISDLLFVLWLKNY